MGRAPQARVPMEGLNDLRNRQTDVMVRPFHEFRGGLNSWAFYAGALPPSWQSLLWVPANEIVTIEAVRRAAESGFSAADFRSLARRVSSYQLR